VTPTYINEAEAVFYRFFDPHRSQLASWTFNGSAKAHCTIQQQFHGTFIRWNTGDQPVGTLSRACAHDISDFDTLVLCCSGPDTATLTVKLVIDGKTTTPIDRVRCTNQSEELEAAVTGNELQHVEISVSDTAGVPTLVGLYWLGFANAPRRAAMEQRRQRYQSRDMWADLLEPTDKPVTFAPKLGLMFDGEQLPALREKFKREPYASAMRQFREIARACLTAEPWRGVGAYPNNIKPRCYRFRATDHIDMMAMRMGGFVGLIDEDEQLLRMAADHALALAHCDHLYPEFMPHIAGSAWEQRPFYEYRWAMNAIYAMDFAGHMLNWSGQQVLAQMIATKALPWFYQTLARHPYVRRCNQGAYFAWGAIICELALAKIFPRGGEGIDVAIRAMDETVNAYFMPDGGAYEGAGYVTSTAEHALVAYAMVARHRDVPLDSLVPPVLRNVGNYLTTMAATTGPIGSAIKVADGGRSGSVMFPCCAGMLAVLTGDTTIASLYAGLLAGDMRESPQTPGSIMSMVLTPDHLPEPGVRPPTFRILGDTGLLCSARQTPHDIVRLQLIGGTAKAGHCHDERGSFVLEAFGDELAIDRGQMNYGDPRSQTLRIARYHNVLIPESADGQLSQQINPCPEATIPQGTGDETRLDASIDASVAVGNFAVHWQRRIVSDEPTTFAVHDDMALQAKGRVAFNLQASQPWQQDGDGWVTRGTHGLLRVTPQWPVDEAFAGEDSVDGDLNPAYRLTLYAAPADHHRLTTLLHVSPL
jgi:hypothetical protein